MTIAKLIVIITEKTKIKSKNLKLAKLLVTQFGGPDGELSASLRYLSFTFKKNRPVWKQTGHFLRKRSLYVRFIVLIC